MSQPNIDHSGSFSAVGFLMLAGAVVLGIEAMKHLGRVTQPATASAAPSSSSGQQSAAPSATGTSQPSNQGTSQPSNTVTSNPSSVTPNMQGVLSDADIARGLYSNGVRDTNQLINAVATVLAESGGNIAAGSSAGAYGIAQFEPGTFSCVGIQGNAGDPNAALHAMALIVTGQRPQCGNGLNPWDAYSYVGVPNCSPSAANNYCEQYVGPGQGSFRQFLGRAQQAVAGLGL